MLPTFSLPRRQRPRPVPQSPPWWIAVGQTQALTQSFSWQEAGVAIAHAPLALSPDQRYVVAGDFWQPGSPTQTPEEALAWVAQRWQKAGAASLAQLQGLFAFVVWDRDQRELWLVRDPVGTQTLYYTPSGPSRWVAPRLRTLNPFHPRTVDAVALRDYLCCAFVPGERTLWQAVRELRPGTVRRLWAGTEQSYWPLKQTIQGADQPLAWHGQRLRSHLEQIVLEYLPDQQPVGVYLSGGLDSSCITALAARLHDQPVHTYSIHFGADLPNELPFSSSVAQQCGTRHHILEISLAQMWQRLPDTLAELDDPIGDPLTVPNRLVGEVARQAVAVVLNGEGGDPCFGGPKNQPMLLNQIYDPTMAGGQAALNAYLRSFQKCAADLPQLLRPPIWQAVASAPSPFSADLNDSETDYLNRLMALNIQFKGADQILTKVSNLTRAAGLVGRSPLFDPRLVALSMAIPSQYKLSGAAEKAVLKAAVADLLPEAIVQRPKSGMMVPVQFGFKQAWRTPARALLLSRRAAIAPYLNQDLIRQWLAYEGDLWGRYGVKLWLLVSLELWLQANR